MVAEQEDSRPPLERKSSPASAPGADADAAATARRRRGTNDVSVANESEAETDILTPVKQKKKAAEDADKDIKRSVSPSPRTRDDDTKPDDPSDRPPSRKRRSVRSGDGTASETPADDADASAKTKIKSRRSSDASAAASDYDSNDSSDVVARQRNQRRRLRRQSLHARPPALEGDADRASADPTSDARPALQLSAASRELSTPLRSQLSPRLRSSHTRASSSNFTSIDSAADPMYRRRVTASGDEQGERSSSLPAAHGTTTRSVDTSGQSPLHKASKKGDINKVKSLLEKLPGGLDINLPDYAGNTALQMASLKGHTNIVQLLLEAGCEANTINQDGDTPLKDAQDNDHDAVVALLKKHGAKEDVPVRSVESAGNSRPRFAYLYQDANPANLLKNIKNGDIEGVGRLLEANVKPDNACLVSAATGTNADIVGLLLSYGADPNPPAAALHADEKTPLHAAIDAGKNNAIKLLVGSGARAADTVPGTGVSYARYIRQRKAHGWQEGLRLLESRSKKGSKASSDGPPTLSPSSSPRNSRLTRPPAAADAPASLNPASAPHTSSDPPVERASSPAPAPAAPATDDADDADDDDQKMTSPPPAASPSPEPAAPPPPPPPPLPPTLQHLLGTPLPRHRQPHSIDKSVEDFLPLYCVPLSALQPDTSPSTSHDLYTPNFYTALLLGYPALDAVRADVSTTHPITPAQRERMWARKPILADQLGQARRWKADARPDFPACRAAGVPVSRRGRYFAVHTEELGAQARDAFFGLSDAQLFWHPLADLVRMYGQGGPALTVKTFGE